MSRLPYPLVCIGCGLLLAWIPSFLHGPIPEKFDLYYIDGATAVWAWYTARMLIGVWVALVSWPERWWLRGPLCGLVAMFPVTIVSLAVPTCGAPCMGWNLLTGAAVGGVTAATAYAVTGKHAWRS